MLVIFENEYQDECASFQKNSVPDCHTKAEGLPLTVIFTNVDSTLAALRHAAELARHLHAQIRVLIMQEVPYSLPLDRPQIPPDFRIRQLMTRSGGAFIATRIDILLCRDRCKSLLKILPPESLVLIGVDHGHWFIRGKRWAKLLEEAGHQVMLVDCGRGASKTFCDRLDSARRISLQTVVDKNVSRFLPFLSASQQTPQSTPNFLVRLLHRLIRRKQPDSFFIQPPRA
jgi:hypothetical protein